MFEAWILVCVVQMGNQCFPAQDNRGPYETHEQCYERTIEMGKDNIRVFRVICLLTGSVFL